MSVAEVLDAPEQTALALFTPATALSVLTSPERFSKFYKEVKAETDKLVADTTTKRGRDAIRSMARKVVSTKTAIDAEGKRLNEDARARIDVVDEARRKIRGEFDALARDVRKPLTLWEEAEETRQSHCAEIMDRLNGATTILATETSADLIARLAAVEAVEITDDEFQELAAGARFARDQALEALANGIERAKAAEAERAELERLRAEAVERERQRLADEEAEAARQLNARREAEEVERQRVAAERAAQAERDRLAEIAAAEERAREEAINRTERERQAEIGRLEQDRRSAEQAAKAAKVQAARDHAAELARVQREADLERERHAATERARQAEVERQAAEQRRRDEDRAHRSKVMGAAKDALLAIKIEGVAITEPAAKAIVLAIVAGEVPAVTLRF